MKNIFNFYGIKALIVLLITIIILAILNYGCQPKYVTQTHTRTEIKHDTIPEPVEIYIPCNQTLDTLLSIRGFGSIEVSVNDTQGFKFYILPEPKTIDETTEDKIPSSVYKKLIKETEQTERTLARQREKTIRDSLNNARKIFGDSVAALWKMFNDSMNAKKVQLKQQRKVDKVEAKQTGHTARVEARGGGFFGILKTIVFWLVIVIALIMIYNWYAEKRRKFYGK